MKCNRGVTMAKIRRKAGMKPILAIIAALTCVGSGSGSWYVPTKSDVKAYFVDLGHMVKACFRDQAHTAALTPGSPWLVHNIARYVPTDVDVNVLEVGAGPGSVTREIMKRMNENSYLDVVEYDKELFDALCENLGTLKDDADGRVVFYHSAIEDWESPEETEGQYDVIISTIPRTQLPLAVMKEILARYDRMLKPGGIIVSETLGGAHQFTLVRKKVHALWLEGISKVMPFYAKKAEEAQRALAEYRALIRYIEQWEREKFTILGDDLTYLNAPPVYVIGLKKKA